MSEHWTDEEVAFMRRALQVAENGRGQVKPNPLVGCVLVKDGEIIAEGWHDHLGGLHAEQMAIADAEKRGLSPNGCIAYVTLEPCNHHGRTPPCTEALLWAGVSEVVVAHRDPNPTVRGKGIEYLREQGTIIREGLLDSEALIQMQPFMHWCETRLPMLTLKIAVDKNLAVDDREGVSQRFTSEESLDAVHRLRRDVDAVVVGVGTVIRDNPSLNVRRVPLNLARQPLRVVLDRELRIPLDSTLVNDEQQTLILHVVGREDRVAALSSRDNVEVCQLQSARTHDGVDLNLVLSFLGDRGFQEVMVEGGPETARRFLRAGLFDRVIVIHTDAEFGDPFPLSITDEELANAGLVPMGAINWGKDEAERWSRANLAWPAHNWP